jgi:hypothetical protein
MNEKCAVAGGSTRSDRNIPVLYGPPIRAESSGRPSVLRRSIPSISSDGVSLVVKTSQPGAHRKAASTTVPVMNVPVRRPPTVTSLLPSVPGPATGRRAI